MPIYNVRIKQIDMSETKRYAGLQSGATINPSILNKACDEVVILSEPRSSWNVYPYNTHTAAILSSPPFVLNGNDISRHLFNAQYVAVLSLTIGDQAENAVTMAFELGNYTFGLLLDAAATTVVESAADEVQRVISAQAAAKGYSLTERFSPGYGDWDINVQKDILRLSGGASIGVKVNSACMLAPRKSITAIIGMIPAEQDGKNRCDNKCISCQMRTCKMRKRSEQS